MNIFGKSLAILLGSIFIGITASRAEEPVIMFELLPGADSAYGLLQYDNYKCFVYPHYFVATQTPEDSDEAGENIFIKIRHPEQNEYQDEDIDDCYEILTEHDLQFPSNGDALYFFGLYKDLLFIDMGTGTSRGWTIHDLSQNRDILTSDYDEPAIDHQGVLSFWTATKILPTRQNCPKFKDYGSDPSSMAIERKVTIKLDTFERTDTTEQRCIYQE